MNILGYDIETTGLLAPDGSNEKDHRIIEVGMMLYKFDGENWTKRGEVEQRIQPHRSIDAKAYEVHGISLNDLLMSPSWDAFAPKMHKIMSSVDLIVAHNGDGFDIPFTKLEFERIGLTMPDIKTFDTYLHGTWATPFGKKPNLRELCFATEVEYDPSKAHAATYDVKVMMEAFFKGVKLGFFTIGEVSE